MLSILAPLCGITVAIAGIRGDLGRELCYQALQRDATVVGLVRPSEVHATIQVPCRRGWLDKDMLADVAMPVVASARLTLVDLKSDAPAYDQLVLCMGTGPFQPDATYDSFESIMANLPRQCRHIVLVSAHGVGDSIQDANAGIRVMRSLYLRSEYRSKLKQEDFLAQLDDEVDVTVLRPRVLSYGHVPFNTIYTRRQDMAARILDHLEESAALG